MFGFKFVRNRQANASAKLAPAEEIPAVDATPTIDDDIRNVAGEHWDAVRSNAPARIRTAWWNDPYTIRHINRLVCGDPIDGDHAGFHRMLGEYLKKTAPGPARALSVGSAEGSKELRLLKTGIVHSFDCYEAGPQACEDGRAAAKRAGLADRFRFYNVDAFTADIPSDYDLVYWNNALHHMPDTAAAVQWSFDRLKPGGLFAMDDYVGATRFQHSPQVMAITNAVMATLPERYLRRPGADEGFVPRALALTDIDALIKIDPSEAMDSGNILPAIKKVFPAAEIIPTGGLLYFVALNDAFHNFEAEEDLKVLDHLLKIDHAASVLTETQYAVVFAVKPR